MLKKYSLQNKNPSHTNFKQLYESYTSFLALPLHPFFAMSGLKHLSPLSKSCAQPCPISSPSCHLKMPVCRSACCTHLPSCSQFLPQQSLSCLELNTLLLLFDFGSTVFMLHVLLKGFVSKLFSPYTNPQSFLYKPGCTMTFIRDYFSLICLALQQLDF